MRIALNLCGWVLLSTAVLLAGAGDSRAGLVGKALGDAGMDEQVQNAGEALYNAATAAAIGGKRGADAGRGITGAMSELALNSGEITCSLWLIQLRAHFRNLVSTAERARALGEDAAEIARLDDLIAKTQDFALKLEAACTKVGWLLQDPAEDWKTVNRLKGALGMGPAGDKPAAEPPPAPPAPPPLPEGWNAADLHCRNMCSGIFEAYANALANSRNKRAEADRLRNGELADANRRQARAQSNLDEVRANPSMDPRNVRRDEMELKKTSDATAQAQAKVDRATAEADAYARRSQELLERLKECIKACRKDVKDLSGLDATRIDTYFTGQVRDGGSAQDAQRFTTLSGDPENRTVTSKPSPKPMAKPALKGPANPPPKPKPIAVGKDGDPAAKDGTGGEQTKVAPDKTAVGMPQTSILDTIDDGEFRQMGYGLSMAACPKCQQIADDLATARKALAESRKLLQQGREAMSRMLLDKTAADYGGPAGYADVQQGVERVVQYRAQRVELHEREEEFFRRQLEECNKTCVTPPEKLVDPPPKPVVATDPAPQAYCQPCEARAKALTAKQAELDAAIKELERQRKNYTDTVVVHQGQDRRVARDPAIIKQAIDLVQQTELTIQRQGEAVRKLEGEMDTLRRGLDECNKSCGPPPPKPIADPPPKPAISTGCNFAPVKPVVIGPKATYGATDDLMKSVAGAASSSFPSMGGGMGGGMMGGGMFGGGGMLGGPSPQPLGADKPKLATDPVRNKQTFTEPMTGTVIQVGSQFRPDGKLLVSIGVDKAADKGIIHQAALERVQYLPDGECGKQAIEPVEWVPYTIWEDWWAKIRIRTYVSVDGGPWRQTSDTGWKDWGSGSRLLESGVMKADQIPGTAWGSMGADRAFGGPRGAGAVFDAGKPIALDKPVPERLVIHVTQPGKDPVSTVGFALYPTYGTGGKITYSDKAPDIDAILREMRPDKGGGMQRIDPPSTAAPSPLREMQLDKGGGMQRIDPPSTAAPMPSGSILDTLEPGAPK